MSTLSFCRRVVDETGQEDRLAVWTRSRRPCAGSHPAPSGPASPVMGRRSLTSAGGAGGSLLRTLSGRPGGEPVIFKLALLLGAIALTTSCVQAQDRGAGQMVFRDQGCYGCHTVGATGTPIAP